MQKEPIWGVVANFVQLLLQRQGHESAVTLDADLRMRLEAFAALYRPKAEDARSSLYKQHAEEIQRAMDPAVRELVAPEAAV